jgi:hypothetical protein
MKFGLMRRRNYPREPSFQGVVTSVCTPPIMKMFRVQSFEFGVQKLKLGTLNLFS